MINQNINHLTYALDQNKELIHISEVPRGLDCKCTCPECGEKLVAKKGTIQRHHFAHLSNIDCPHAYETSLHLLAKKVIEKGCIIHLPEILLESERKAELVGKKSPDKINAYNFKPDFAKIEVAIKDFRPDIVAYKKGIPLIIEIFVTHKVNEEKIKRIKEAGISAIQIDLSSIDREITENEIIKLLKSGCNTKWIYNRKVETETNDYIVNNKRQIFYDSINESYYIEDPPCKNGSKTILGHLVKYTQECEKCEFYKGTEGDKSLEPSYLMCNHKN